MSCAALQKSSLQVKRQPFILSPLNVNDPQRASTFSPTQPRIIRFSLKYNLNIKY